ncbi:hypothetical protein EJD97_018568, partial [Solanum chilense]
CFRTHGNHEELNVMDEIILNQSLTHQDSEEQGTWVNQGVEVEEKYVELKAKIVEAELKELKANVDKHMVEIKNYVDNFTKLIIEEIRLSRGQQRDDVTPSVAQSEEIRLSRGQSTSDAQQRDDVTPNVAQSEEIRMSRDEGRKSTAEFFNANLPGSSTSKPPTLDDYPDFTMTQIIALDSILNANTTPDVQTRHMNLDKYESSPYIRLSKAESSSKKIPIFFTIKHPFASHNGFDVLADMFDQFNKWLMKDDSKKRD